MVCGALCLVESGLGFGVETEEGWRRLEMEMVEGSEEDDEDGERCGG